MRTYSTPQSALNQEITKLAIIESIAAIGLYVAIGAYLGTFRYLAAAVIFAPLMLFRTEVSAEWGFKIYERSLNKLDENEFLNRLPPVGRSIAKMLITPAVGTSLRIVATVYWAVRRPLQTLGDTPQNWLRQCLCTDFVHPPELVPLEAAKGSSNIPTFLGFLEVLRDEPEFSSRAVLIIAASPFILLGWVPSIVYRISFKATALAYTPFIWAAHATLRSQLPVKTRLERITKGELEKVRRGFSWIIVTTLVAKFALLFTWVDRAYVESKFPSQKFVANFVILDGWPWWQITLGTDAVLTFVLLFFADAALARLDGEKTWREGTVLKTLATVSFVRAILSIATVSHFFYVAFRASAPNSVLRLLSS